MYGTTREFLNHLGLKGIGQLPDLPDLEAVVSDPEELREFASQIGRDVTTEELEDYFAADEADFLAEGEEELEMAADSEDEELRRGGP